MTKSIYQKGSYIGTYICKLYLLNITLPLLINLLNDKRQEFVWYKFLARGGTKLGNFLKISELVKSWHCCFISYYIMETSWNLSITFLLF